MLFLVLIYASIGVSYVLSSERGIECKEYKDWFSCWATNMKMYRECTWIKGECKKASTGDKKQTWYENFEKCEKEEPSYKTQTEKYFLVSEERLNKYKITFRNNNGIYSPKNTFFSRTICFKLPRIIMNFNYTTFNLEKYDNIILRIKNESRFAFHSKNKAQILEEKNFTFYYPCFSIDYFNSEEKHQPPFEIKIYISSKSKKSPPTYYKKILCVIFGIYGFYLSFCYIFNLRCKIRVIFCYLCKKCEKCCSCLFCKCYDLPIAYCFTWCCYSGGSEYSDYHCNCNCNCDCDECCSCCCKKKTDKKPKEIEINEFEPPKVFKESKNKKVETNNTESINNKPTIVIYTEKFEKVELKK